MVKVRPCKMWSNTKLLVIFCFLIIVLGLGFLWYGLSPAEIKEIPPQPTTPPVVENTPIATTSASLGIDGERAYVIKVVDGDTFSAKGGPASGWEGEEVTVRFIGIDTPETVDPRRPVGCFGKQASNETKSILSGKMVILQRDISDKDKYGRLLRYVFLPLDDGRTLFVDDYLVREGFARVYTYPPDVKYNEQLREAEREARENNRGLWGRC